MLMHFKYSNVMNLIFVAFLHGVALPILFPIAFFGVFNNFLVERLLLAWYYKQPPLFDNRLNDRGLEALMYAPFFMLANAYWVLGNRQMFNNEYSTKLLSTGESDNPKHSILSVEYHLAPILIAIPLLWFQKLYIKSVTKLLIKFGFLKPLTYLDGFKKSAMAVNEGLGSFW